MTRRQLQWVPNTRGFSLIELLVVIAILIFMTSLVFTMGTRSRSGLEVTNMAHEVAFLVREAQSYGVAVREQSAGSGEFNLGYGLYLTTAQPTTIVLFQDKNRDGVYQTTPVDETFSTFTLKKATMHRFCGMLSEVQERCSHDSLLKRMTIVFTRPDPDALINGFDNSGQKISDEYVGANLYLQSPDGVERKVNVRLTGQISVE